MFSDRKRRGFLFWSALLLWAVSEAALQATEAPQLSRDALAMPRPIQTAALKQIAPPPLLSARSFLLLDYNTGRIIAEKEARTRLDPASLTKMMTVYVVDQWIKQGRLKPTDPIAISEKAWRMDGSKMFIGVNTQIPVSDLIQGIIIQSGNDASIALAEHVAGSEAAFAQIMNDYASALGMRNTHFSNATGMPHPDHYTTTEDLAILAAALIRDFPDTYKLYSEKYFTYQNIRQPNRNRLLWSYDWVDGIKTGFTEEAGYCLAASGEQRKRRLIAIVMGTKSDRLRTEEAAQLLNYGFRSYENWKLVEAGKALRTARVLGGQQSELPVGVTSDLEVTIPQGFGPDLHPQLVLKQPLEAPIQKGQVVGTIKVDVPGGFVLEKPLEALEAIPEGHWFRITWDKACYWATQKWQDWVA